MEAPEKIYIHPDIGGREFLRPWLPRAANNESVEYVRKDAFIEKAKEFIWEHTDGTDYHVNYILKEFEKYMEE